MDQPKKLPTTIYLDPRIAKAAKVKAALTDKSFSDVVNESLSRYLAQDAADLELARARRKEPTVGYETVLAEMKRDGLL